MWTSKFKVITSVKPYISLLKENLQDMFCKYACIISESLAQICTTIAEIQNFWFVIVDPVFVMELYESSAD